MKQFAIIFVVIVLVGFGITYFVTNGFGTQIESKQTPSHATTPEVTPTQNNRDASSTVSTSTLDSADEVMKAKTSIGTSVEGRDIKIFHYGTGDTEVLFVGGIHGGYAWNTVTVAYQLIDYLKQNPDAIPSNVIVTVIPDLNPDGLYKIAGTDGAVTKSDVPAAEADTIPGRFNANNVDLNRNFDCDWQASGTWQSKTVSGGSTAFSEPETQALRDYIASHKPAAVVAWYSAAGGVYASQCHNGVSTETSALTQLYAQASGYKAYENFDFYAITGDMMNWLAKKDIPAISVLLTNHTDTEWDKNKAGIDAVLQHYKK